MNQLQSLQRPASFGVAVGEVEGGLSKFDDGEVSADGDAVDVEGDGASSKCSEIHQQVRIQKQSNSHLPGNGSSPSTAFTKTRELTVRSGGTGAREALLQTPGFLLGQL